MDAGFGIGLGHAGGVFGAGLMADVQAGAHVIGQAGNGLGHDVGKHPRALPGHQLEPDARGAGIEVRALGDFIAANQLDRAGQRQTGGQAVAFGQVDGFGVVERDARLSHDTREAVIAAITVTPDPKKRGGEAAGSNRVAARAVALRAVLSSAPAVLSPGEQVLLGEWLDRLSAV